MMLDSQSVSQLARVTLNMKLFSLLVCLLCLTCMQMIALMWYSHEINYKF